MIRLLYGAGYDETQQTLCRSIKDTVAAGKRAVLLVPEQETVSRERQMLRLLPPSAQLSFEVLNFTRLANRTFRTVGGLSHRYATRGVSALLMWRTLREVAPLLTKYGESAAGDIHFCDTMLSAKAQFKAYLVSPDTLLGAAEQLEEEDPLGAKLHDIGLILASFERALYDRFDDMEDDLTRLAAILKDNGRELFADTVFFVDSFTDFTAQELAVLGELMQVSPEINFTTPLPSVRDGSLHLSSARHTVRRLERLAAKAGKEVFVCPPTKKKPTRSAELLADRLFDMTAEPSPLAAASWNDLTVTACPSPFAEAEHAAATIHRLVREGARYRDIAVVMRDANGWSGIIDATLEKEGIPFFFSEKTDLTLHPLIKLILYVLRIGRYGWRGEDVIGYLKTGFCPVSRDDVYLFEEYANTWRLRGAKSYAAPFTKNPDGYTTIRSRRGEEILAAANRVREAIYPALSAFFTAAEEEKSASALCRSLYELLTSLGVADTLKAQADTRLRAGKKREAEELSRLWGVMVDALESLSDTLCDEPLSLAQFSDALSILFAETDIGSIPTAADEVTVGSASTLRADHPRFVLVLGLNEGEFPRIVSENGLLGDAEKRKLSELGIELSATTDTQTSDELFYAWRALTAPQQGLYLSYSEATTEGRAATPSFVLERVKKLFPFLREERFDAADPLSHIFTPEAAAEHLPELDPARRRALLPLLEEHGVTGLSHYGLPITEQNARISPEAARDIFSRNTLSPSQLESYASCRFAYYCSRILRLREEPSNTLSAADTGIFIHHVLEHVMGTMRAQSKRLSDYTADEVDALVDHIFTDYKKELIEAGGEFSPRTEALLRRYFTLARLIVSSIAAELADSSFTPAFLELDLSRLATPPALHLEDGTRIPLNGKIDRVDVYHHKASNEAYLRVVDYKTGTRKFDPDEIERGFCLQMPLYLMALCREHHPDLVKQLGLGEGTPLRPAAVSYLSTAIGTEHTPARIEEEAAMEAALSRLSREGVVLNDEEIKGALSHSLSPEIVGGGRSKSQRQMEKEELEGLFDRLTASVSRINSSMKSGHAEAIPNEHGGRLPCEYCPFDKVCRASKKQKNQ